MTQTNRTLARRFLPVALMLAVAALATPAAAQQQTNPAAVRELEETGERRILLQLKARAEGFLQALMSGNATRVQGDMDAKIRKNMTSETAKRIFGDLITRGEGLDSVEPAKMSVQPDGAVVAMIPIHMKNSSVSAQIVFERLAPTAKITGFSLLPFTGKRAEPSSTQPNADGVTPPPAYATKGLFKEKTYDLTTDDVALSAVLTLPSTAGTNAKVPGVLLLSGFGPFDQDASVGPNKPFRDLAQGLAVRGVAVLRYARREKSYPEKFRAGTKYDLEDYALEDARNAVRALSAVPEVDPSRITVVGHDLGGFLAPVVAEGGGVASLVLLAPLPVPIDDYIRSQSSRLLAGGVDLSPEMEAKLKQSLASADRLGKGEFKADESLMNYPGTLWLDLKRQNPIRSMAGIQRPLAILYADRDFIVPADDQASWTGAIASRSDAVVRTYAGLNHLFIANKEEKATPEGMFAPGNVDERAVADIAEFVLKGRLKELETKTAASK